MNKIKILAFAACAAILAACGSDDGSPPSLRNSNIGFISPFDTLKAEFDSEIVNINELNASNILASTNVHLLSDGKNSSKILFAGGNLTPGGSRYFTGGLLNALIAFKNLRNSDDYKRDSTALYFSTYQILDDLSGGNDTYDRAVDLEPFFAGDVNAVSFAGILDGMIAPSTINMKDYYKIQLRKNDTLKVSAKSRDTLYINVIEPGKNSVNEILGVSSTKNDNRLEFIIRDGHLDMSDITGKLVDFYIIASAVNLSPNPYTLSISRSRPK